MNTASNVANLFDRNPLHVTHLQGPVDRLPDSNLRAIYEKAGKILLIQRWKDIKSGDPHVFLLFETEQAASACCSRIGTVRITSDRQSTRPITASLLSCANPSANSILYMWLRSQSMTPSYTIKNPPPVPPCAAFPLSCLTPLTENCGLVAQMLNEHKCEQSWSRFVAQMYVSNKMWAAAQFILAQGVKPGGSATEGTIEAGKGKNTQKDTSEDIIDISDDSMVENISDNEGEDFARMQQLQKSSTSAQPKVSTIGKHNVWLPRKRANVQGARAKLGVVPAKQAAKQSAEKPTTSPTEPQPVRALPAPSTTEAPPKPEPSPAKPTQPSVVPAISPPFVPTPMDPTTPELTSPTLEVASHTPPTVPTPLSAQSSASSKTSNPPPIAPPQTRSRSKASTPCPPPTTAGVASGSKLATSSSKSAAKSNAKTPSAPNSRAPSRRSTATPAPIAPPANDSVRPEEQPRRTATPQVTEAAKTQQAQEKPSSATEKPTSTPAPSANPSRQGSAVAPARQQSSAPDLPAPPSSAPLEPERSGQVGEESASPDAPVEANPAVAPPTAEKPNDQTVSADQRPVDQVRTKLERSSPGPSGFSEPIRKVSGSGQGASITSFGTTITAPAGVVTRPITPIHITSTAYEDLSFFGRSSSPGALDLVPSSVVPSLSSSSLSPSSSTSFSPKKRKAEPDSRAFDSRLKRRRPRASSKSDMVIVLEPEVSALQAEQARAAELQAEEDRVREILEPPSPSSTTVSEFLGNKIDLSDYPETIASRLLGLKSRSQKSSSPLSKRSSISSVARATDDEPGEGNRRASLADMDPRAWRATLDENEALKMKIKVLELTLPTAETVKNELHAERKEKAQLIEALEIERSLMIQSEALRRQLDVTREEQTTRIRQLEDRLADSATAAEKAREAAQVATEQRRKAEEASHVADAERTKLGVLLDAERALVNSERAALAREREAKAVVESKLAATEARLSAEQRRSIEASEEAEKERTKAKDFLEAEKAIVVAQEATLEREREIRAEIEAKLEASEAKLEAEQARHAEALKSLETRLQQDLARVMGLVESERRLVQNERAKVVEEHDARSKVEKELVMLKEGLDTTNSKLKTSDENLTKAQEEASAAQRELAALKDKLHDTELREHSLRSQVYNCHGQLNAARETTVAAEGRAKAAEERVRLSEFELRHKTTNAADIYQQLTTEKEVLMMERATLARERLMRKDLEKQLAQVEERTVALTKHTTELHRQLQDAQSSSEQMQTQRTMLHIARTRIQELEQAIQRVEHELDVSRSAEATAKTMLQLGWGSHYEAGRSTIRRTHSSPISDIVTDRQSDDMDEDAEQAPVDPFLSLVKPPRQQSFKLKRSVLPARLLKVDMPQGEGVDIDLGGLPANPTAIIDLLHRSKCTGVFWDIIMDEYGAMGCFDAAEAVAAGKLKHQLQ